MQFPNHRPNAPNFDEMMLQVVPRVTLIHISIGLSEVLEIHRPFRHGSVLLEKILDFLFTHCFSQLEELFDGCCEKLNIFF